MGLIRTFAATLAAYLATDELRSPGTRLGPADDRPLTDQELQMVTRLFGDPFSFPLTFKAWLVSYLEASDMNLPISAVNGLTDILGVASAGGGTPGIFPAGLILPCGPLAAPQGSLLCDVASSVRTDQPRLFDAIGTTYGAVDGTHFSVPDLRGRVAVGKGTHAEHDVLNDSEGLAVGSRHSRHRHQVALNFVDS